MCLDKKYSCWQTHKLKDEMLDFINVSLFSLSKWPSLAPNLSFLSQQNENNSRNSLQFVSLKDTPFTYLQRIVCV